MANTTLTADIIAKEAVRILDNEMVMGNKVYRGYEDEFDKKVNGYKVGETISIRKPTDFTVRDGAVMNVQDVVEGKTTITVDKQKGIDFEFTSKDLTLEISELSDRVIKPAMIQLANQVDVDLHALYKDIPSWVGTPGNTINSFADFAKGPERLDEYGVPQDGRFSVLSPADNWGLIGSQTSLYTDSIVKPAYRSGTMGMIAGVDNYMSQNVAAHTTGADVTGTVGAAITSATTTYASIKDTNVQTITTANVTLAAGDVIEIADVYAVNPVTKAKLAFKKQFTVVSYTTNSAVISPALIWDGAFQNIAVTSGVTDLNTKAITSVQTAAGVYRTNMIAHKNAFSLVSVPLIMPPGAPSDSSRRSHKGLNVRVIPVYDGINDKSAYRLDILYGVKTIDPRLATRISGSA